MPPVLAPKGVTGEYGGPFLAAAVLAAGGRIGRGTAGFDEPDPELGIVPHDGTALLGPPWEKYASKPFETIEERMVFTIEPRLTAPGRGVVTVEEMVLVTADGAEYPAEPQKELILLG